MEDRLEGARVEAGSPVTGPAAVGARGGGGRAVGGGRDSRQERKEVAGLGTRFERRMDETCPLCPPPSDSPGLSLYDPAVPPTPTADFSSFPAFLGILLRSNQEWPVRVLPWGLPDWSPPRILTRQVLLSLFYRETPGPRQPK